VSLSASTASAKPEAWFPDTSTLITLAHRTPLGDAVRSYFDGKGVVLLEAVVDELEALTSTKGSVAPFAKKALRELSWAREPVPIKDADIVRALEFQNEIRGGEALSHDLEHWGESAIIALASLAQHRAPIMLSEDYNARAAANRNKISSYSVHKLLSRMIRENQISATDAEAHANALQRAGRASDYTAAELTSGRLGRVGQP
jgi:predicted ribonuclease YlaK